METTGIIGLYSVYIGTPVVHLLPFDAICFAVSLLKLSTEEKVTRAIRWLLGNVVK